MKKAFKIFYLYVILMLSACSNNTENADAQQTSASLASQVDFTETEGQTLKSEQVQTDVSESVSEEEYISDEEKRLLNALDNLSAFGGGMLYDFDFDDIPEIVIFDYGMEETYYSIFRYDGSEFLYMGNIAAYDHIEGSDNIVLYYSENDDEYFYCANNITFVKNNSEDKVGYGFYCGNLYKYVFLPNKMESSVILSYMDDYEDEEALKKYLQDCEDYLSRFEKSESVNFEAMWSADEMRDGTYKSIVLDEFRNFYQSSDISGKRHE